MLGVNAAGAELDINIESIAGMLPDIAINFGKSSVESVILADKMKETRLKKGRLASIKNIGGAGGLTQQATLSKPGLVSDESKMLLGA